VTVCTSSRRKILANTDLHLVFREYCQRSPQVLSTHVGRYIIMPDHIHVFVSCAGSHALSRWTKGLKGTLAKHLRAKGISGPFWQDGFFDHLLRSSESYGDKWNYVFRNPERAGLVQNAEGWEFAGEIECIVW